MLYHIISYDVIWLSNLYCQDWGYTVGNAGVSCYVWLTDPVLAFDWRWIDIVDGDGIVPQNSTVIYIIPWFNTHMHTHTHTHMHTHTNTRTCTYTYTHIHSVSRLCHYDLSLYHSHHITQSHYTILIVLPIFSCCTLLYWTVPYCLLNVLSRSSSRTVYTDFEHYKSSSIRVNKREIQRAESYQRYH